MNYERIYPSASLYPSTNIYPFNTIYACLVYNRSLADIVAMEELKAKIKSGTATASEIATWNDAKLHSSYNAEDLNRVGYALNFVKNELASVGGIHVTYPYAVRTNYTSSDVLSSTDIAHYLANVSALRNALTQWITTTVPTTVKSLADANAIEYILYQCEAIIIGTQQAYRYSAEIYAGEQY